MSEIIVAIITGTLSLIGVIWSNRSTRTQIQQDLLVHQAVTDTKLEELTREVREHNNFAKRMPVVENEIEHINEELHHLQDYHKQEEYL